MIREQKFLLFAVVPLFVLIFVGCGTKSAELVEATGILKIDGVPAENIMIHFVPKTTDESVNAPTSHGLTDAEGKFVLRSAKNELGALAGPHLVTLYDTELGREAQGEASTKPRRLDSKYSHGGMEVQVVAGKLIEITATSPK